jgi:hypothetical protein
MGVQGEAVVETNHEMLADRFDCADGRSCQSLQLFWSCRDHQLALEGQPEHDRGAMDRVAFRHRINTLPK